MEVYVDNMIVKSKRSNTHLVDLVETFRTLKRFHMHLDPSKCGFGVVSDNLASSYTRGEWMQISRRSRQ